MFPLWYACTSRASIRLRGDSVAADYHGAPLAVPQVPQLRLPQLLLLQVLQLPQVAPLAVPQVRQPRLPQLLPLQVLQLPQVAPLVLPQVPQLKGTLDGILYMVRAVLIEFYISRDVQAINVLDLLQV